MLNLFFGMMDSWINIWLAVPGAFVAVWTSYASGTVLFLMPVYLMVGGLMFFGVEGKVLKKVLSKTLMLNVALVLAPVLIPFAVIAFVGKQLWEFYQSQQRRPQNA